MGAPTRVPVFATGAGRLLAECRAFKPGANKATSDPTSSGAHATERQHHRPKDGNEGSPLGLTVARMTGHTRSKASKHANYCAKPRPAQARLRFTQKITCVRRTTERALRDPLGLELAAPLGQPAPVRTKEAVARSAIQADREPGQACVASDARLLTCDARRVFREHSKAAECRAVDVVNAP